MATVEIFWQVPSKDEIDLYDYGYTEDAKWSDLSEEEQSEILDSLRDDHILMVKEIR